MTGTEPLIQTLKKLRLSGILDTLDLRTRQALDDGLSHSEFLFRLLSDEVERRDSRQLDQRLRRASFESHKTLEDFDWRFNPKIPKDKLLEFGTCQYIVRKEVLILCGPSGTGKSHIAQACGYRACRAGHTVLYSSAHQLFTSLRAARADHSYDRQLLRYTSVDLLIVDDLGLRPLTPEEAMDFYELIRIRYERGALLCTSNRAVSEWGTLFGDALLASAAMDRLLHHAHVVVMDGPSYRTQRGQKRKAGSSPDPQEVSG
jgi:DNA replication protein DnaC